MKIKFKLIKFDEAIAMQVYYMDERFRNKKMHTESVYKCSNGARIYSNISFNFGGISNEYHICGGVSNECHVYLWGRDKKKDNRVEVKYFISNKKRDDYVDWLIEALIEWSIKWNGWIEKHEIKVKNDVYTI